MGKQGLDQYLVGVSRALKGFTEGFVVLRVRRRAPTAGQMERKVLDRVEHLILMLFQRGDGLSELLAGVARLSAGNQAVGLRPLHGRAQLGRRDESLLLDVIATGTKMLRRQVEQLLEAHVAR